MLELVGRRQLNTDASVFPNRLKIYTHIYTLKHLPATKANMGRRLFHAEEIARLWVGRETPFSR